MSSELNAALSELQEFTVPFSVKARSDGTLLLRGVATTYDGTPDLYGEAFDESTMRAAFEKYMDTSPTVALEHDSTYVLGRITEAIYSSTGIEVVAEIPRPAAFAPSILKQAYKLIETGVLACFSVGGRWAKLPIAGGVQKLFASQIAEVSVASQGVNPAATFEVVGVKALSLDGEVERLAALTETSSLDDALDELRSI